MAHLDAVERVADYDVPVDPMELTAVRFLPVVTDQARRRLFAL